MARFPICLAPLRPSLNGNNSRTFLAKKLPTVNCARNSSLRDFVCHICLAHLTYTTNWLMVSKPITASIESPTNNKAR